MNKKRSWKKRPNCIWIILFCSPIPFIRQVKYDGIVSQTFLLLSLTFAMHKNIIIMMSVSRLWEKMQRPWMPQFFVSFPLAFAHRHISLPSKLPIAFSSAQLLVNKSICSFTARLQRQTNERTGIERNRESFNKWCAHISREQNETATRRKMCWCSVTVNTITHTVSSRRAK